MLFWAWVPVVSIYGLFLFASLPDLNVRAKMDTLAARLAPPAIKSASPEAGKTPPSMRVTL